MPNTDKESRSSILHSAPASPWTGMQEGGRPLATLESIEKAIDALDELIAQVNDIRVS